MLIEQPLKNDLLLLSTGAELLTSPSSTHTSILIVPKVLLISTRCQQFALVLFALLELMS